MWPNGYFATTYWDEGYFATQGVSIGGSIGGELALLGVG